jgi:hypothetical protein
MPQKTTNRDNHLTVRVSSDELLVIDARAMLSGVDRSEFVRQMIEKSWAARLAKAHRPYVGLSGILLEISPKLVKLNSRQTLSGYESKQLEDTLKKLDFVLDKITERMALDQERELNADNEEETFE